MEPWLKNAQLRKEVCKGRSFNPDEFAVHLDRAIVKKAPEDCRGLKQFFARTCFIRAFREHGGMVFRRPSCLAPEDRKVVNGLVGGIFSGSNRKEES